MVYLNFSLLRIETSSPKSQHEEKGTSSVFFRLATSALYKTVKNLCVGTLQIPQFQKQGLQLTLKNIQTKAYDTF